MHSSDGKIGSGLDVIDADYVIVAPPSRPAVRSSAAVSAKANGMDMLSPVAAAGRWLQSERAGPLFWMVGLVAVFGAFWVAGGHTLLTEKGASRTVSAQIRIASFNSRVEESGEKPMLVIDGEAINGGSASTIMPPLQISVVSSNGSVTRYKLGTAGASLPQGAVFPFSGRLDLPKHGVKTVSVAFAE